MKKPVEKNIVKHSSEKGFTLIELLLVMVILTVLAAVVVPKFTKRSEQARITAANTDISNLEVALDAFEVDMGRYPTSTEGLKALVEQPTSTTTTNWKGPYIKRGIPSDPWGNQYIFTIPGKHNTSGYDLCSYGPDGKEGGSDDIDNWSTR
jgi:general secretion pathway protein G